MDLTAQADHSTFVRYLVHEVWADADSVAFRLEGVGYDCLYISSATALLCQAVAQLKLQLPAVAGETMAG